MLPELNPAHCDSRIRIPVEQDVLLTPRVRRLIDTRAMQRLKGISQLGLVAHVYPGATHSRFEHSLGVYRLACQVLNHLLASQAEFAQALTDTDASVFLVAALLHDVGHWPYCHPIEDMRLDWVPDHEVLASNWIGSAELSDCIRSDWHLEPEQVAKFLASSGGATPEVRVLQNVLGGPIDIDKMDYLQRDSLHAGVPYGRNFDLSRLIGSQCLGAERQSIAITDKGKTAAEMMVFARYVMFSEVYWHHAVRSATAMLQRLVFELPSSCQGRQLFELQDAEFAASLVEAACEQSVGVQRLAGCLFGPQRRLYKRRGQYSIDEQPEIHRRLAGRPYGELVRVATRLASWLDARHAARFEPTDVLIDAPPAKLEVQFHLDVKRTREGIDHFAPLHTISPVVKALATEQFDNYVKRVRVFIAPEVAQGAQIDPLELQQALLTISEDLE